MTGSHNYIQYEANLTMFSEKLTVFRGCNRSSSLHGEEWKQKTEGPYRDG